MLNIGNYIESQYRAILTEINTEFVDLYNSIEHPKLKEVLATLHYQLVISFKTMNERLPTGEYTAHFWAEPSRELIKAIDIATGLQRTLKNSQYAFVIDKYYTELIAKCNEFLSSSGGSVLPAHMEKVDLYYTIPIFVSQNIITVGNTPESKSFELKLIGEGSYANVYKYKDSFYQKWFVLKRAKKNLSEKELIRFRREFEQMYELNSPYIVQVYCYNDVANEYIMEYMDCSLYQYIEKHNSDLGHTA